MSTATTIILGLLAGVILVQTVTTAWFLRVLRRKSPDPLPDDQCPRVAVVLCLRGTDPYLETTVHSLLNQDYPDFEIRVVVDGERDPAWDVVWRIVVERPSPAMRISPLKNPADTCSLKCSSVLQAIRELDDEVEVVALLDADTIPHPTWLRELVAPLSDPTVGVATGNRWYMPEKPTLSSLIRYIWNAAAVGQMVCFQIAWGGTLAIKRSLLARTDLADRWGKAFCEDTMLFRVLKEQGLRQVFVPSLMMINREHCTLAGFRHWVTRQLLTARLYHPSWLGTVVHGFAMTATPAAAVAAIVMALVVGEPTKLAALASGLVLLPLSCLLLLIPCERQLRSIAKRRGESARWLTMRTVAMFPLAMLATQLVYPMLLFKAMFISRVEWRGVHYLIGGPWSIKLEEHTPYEMAYAGEGESL